MQPIHSGQAFTVPRKVAFFTQTLFTMSPVGPRPNRSPQRAGDMVACASPVDGDTEFCLENNQSVDGDTGICFENDKMTMDVM